MHLRSLFVRGNVPSKWKFIFDYFPFSFKMKHLSNKWAGEWVGERIYWEAGMVLSTLVNAPFSFGVWHFVLLDAELESQGGSVCGQNCVQPGTELSCLIKPICKHLASGQFQSSFGWMFVYEVLCKQILGTANRNGIAWCLFDGTFHEDKSLVKQ